MRGTLVWVAILTMGCTRPVRAPLEPTRGTECPRHRNVSIHLHYANMGMEQEGVPSRRIAGKVVYGERPVAGALVVLLQRADKAEERRTNERGEFDFGVRPARMYRVVASQRGLTDALSDVDLRNPTEDTDTVTLELAPCEARVAGVVRDGTGHGIAGARVGFGGTKVSDATSDLAGRYSLCLPRPRGDALFAGAKGMGTVFALFHYSDGTVRQDFTLLPEATIEGVAVDGAGGPVSGAEVFLQPDQQRRGALAHAITDDRGRFRLSRLAPGRHELLAFAAGQRSARPVTAIVEAGGTLADLKLPLVATVTVQGNILDHGVPVAGAAVTVRSEGNERFLSQAISQADGSFSIRGVRAGAATLEVADYDVVRREPVEVGPTGSSNLTVQVAKLSTICGRVLVDGKPARGFDLIASGTSFSLAETDAEGRFALRGLKPGPHEIRVTPDPKYSSPLRIEVGEGTVRRGVDIVLSSGTSVSGRVEDQDGKPIAGVGVVIQGHKSSGRGTTGTDGAFVARGLETGSYRVSVEQYLFGPTLPPVGTFPVIEVGSANLTNVRISVRHEHLTIDGRVLDFAGGGRPNVHVQASPVRGQSMLQQMPEAITAADGSFIVRDLPAGDYFLRALTIAGAEAMLTIPAGARGAVLTLVEPGTVRGVLSGFTRVPCVRAARRTDRASVYLRADHAGVYRGADVRDDTFTIEHVPPGTYLVQALNDGEAAYSFVEVPAGGTVDASLVSTGTATVEGTLTDFETGAPIVGAACEARLKLIGENTFVDEWREDVPQTDVSGSFQLAAPAGEVVVSCTARGTGYAEAGTLLRLRPGEKVIADLETIERSEKQTVHIGTGFDWPMPAPRIDRIFPGGPAARAGLRVGDLIVAIDDVSVEKLSAGGVMALIATKRPGSRIDVTVVRGGRRQNFRVEVIRQR